MLRFKWAQYAIAAFGVNSDERPHLKVAFDGRFRTCYPQELVDMYFDFAIGDAPPRPHFAIAHLGFYSTLVVILGASLLLFLISFAAHPQLVLVAVLTLVSASIIILLRHAITWRTVGIGIGLTAICLILSYLGGRLNSYMAFYLGCIAVLFVGGTLLAKATSIAQVQFADGNWGKAATSFLGGCLLATPAALLNVSYGAHSGDVWVDQAWEPLYALVPGVSEETWARLFMLTLVYAVLSSSSPERPMRAVFAAIMIAAFVHAFAHLPAAMVFSPAALQAAISALFFGVPLGLIYVRLGFEWAVGYHFFIDLVRFGVAFLAQ